MKIEKIKKILCATSITYQGIFYAIMGAKIHNTATISDTLTNYEPVSGRGFGEKSVMKFLDIIDKNNLLIIEKPQNWLLIGAVISLILIILYILDNINQANKFKKQAVEFHKENLDHHIATQGMVLLSDVDNGEEKKD